MAFTALSVSVISPSVTSEYAVEIKNNSALLFQHDEVKRFEVQFMADPNDINKQLQVFYSKNC